MYWSEFAGTFSLIAAGLSIVIATFGSGSPLAAIVPSLPLRRLFAGALFGATGALISISPVGRISGAHINPAVTFAFWLEGMLAWRDALGFVAGQFLGAAAGAVALLFWGEMGMSVQYGATAVGVGVSAWTAFAGEVAATGFLVLVLFITAAHERTRAWTPWTLPPLFAWLVWWEGPLSGASTNPARSFGPALISGDWQDFWIYAVGPLLGAALAVALLKCEVMGTHRVAVAKLFHFE